MSEFERDQIFDGPTLRVYRTRSPRPKHDRVVFTFHGWARQPKFSPVGFGEGFFANQGVDAIHFLTNKNNWYQQPEMREAIAHVTPIANAYAGRSSYGSSMGGYAAILFSDWLNVDVVSAFSPQFSIQRSILPNERRWLKESLETEFLYDDMASMASKTAKVLVAYDPTDDDDIPHMRLLRSTIVNLREFVTPLSSHHVLRFLHEIGLLSEFLDSSVRGELDHSHFRTRIRTLRRTSSFYFSTAAVKCAQRSWLAKADALLELFDALPVKRPPAVVRADKARELIEARRALPRQQLKTLGRRGAPEEEE